MNNMEQMPNIETNPTPDAAEAMAGNPAAAEAMAGKPEQENEQERLEKARQELRDFQEEERSGKKRTVHLLKTGLDEQGQKTEVNIDNLTEEDLRIWERRNELTQEEFSAWRQQIIPLDERDRRIFGDFIANIVTLRFGEEALKKMKEEKEKI